MVLKVVGTTVTVVGKWKVVTWDLPTGDHTPNTIMALEDSARTINFRSGSSIRLLRASISPDSCYIATIEGNELVHYLVVYNIWKNPPG